MRLAPLLLAAGTLPFITAFILTQPDDPSFGVSCGAALPGEPGVVTLDAGPHAPATIRVHIGAARSASSSSVSGIQVIAGAQSGSCSTDTHGPYRVYLNSADAAEVSLLIDNVDTVVVRGLRGNREWSSVTITPDHWVDARLSW